MNFFFRSEFQLSSLFRAFTTSLYLSQSETNRWRKKKILSTSDELDVRQEWFFFPTNYFSRMKVLRLSRLTFFPCSTLTIPGSLPTVHARNFSPVANLLTLIDRSSVLRESYEGWTEEGWGTRGRLSMSPSQPGSRKILIVELSRGYLACSIPGVEARYTRENSFSILITVPSFREVDGIACLPDRIRPPANPGIIVHENSTDISSILRFDPSDRCELQLR